MRKPVLKDGSLLIQKNYINGSWIDAVSGRTFEVHDPASGDLIGTCPESSVLDGEKAIQAAKEAFPAWRSLTGRERGRILRRWYDLLIENRGDVATLISWENGKPQQDAIGEVNLCASFLEWFSEEAARIYGDVIPHSVQGNRVITLKQPIGVCGLITPWNFPAAMVGRKLSPALAAGCTVVIKSAGETPFSANAIVRLGEKAGVPRGVVNVVTALQNTPEIGALICKSEIVRKVSFTGSTRVGKLLMKQSSDTLKKMSLELGGNAPFIIFNDADMDKAISGLIASKFKCSGQTCVSANRIFLQNGIHDRFVKRLVHVVSQLKLGPGLDESTKQGPLIHVEAVQRTMDHVNDALQKGARLVYGGKRALELGPNFFQPTILTGINHKMKIAQEEIFGPIVGIFKFETEADVISMANDSEVGLAAYVFTEDLGCSVRLSELLQVGMVAINTGVISDAASPFGGVKYSGLGREGSKYGIEEYLEVKTVVTGSINTSYHSQL